MASAKESKKAFRDQSDSIWYYKVGFAIFYLLQATAAIILAFVVFGDAGTSDCTRLTAILNVTSDYRVDGTIKDPSTATSLYWGWPAIEVVGPINVGLVIGLASGTNVVWLAAQLFFHEREVAMIANDHNPFRWWRFAWSQGLIWLGVLVVAGIPNVWILTLATLVVLAWLFDFNNTERFNSASVNQLRFQNVVAEKRVKWYVYDDYLFALVKFTVFAFLVYWYLGEAASPDAFDADGVGLPAAAWVVPIAAGVLYLALPVILAVHHAEWGLESVFDKERALFWWEFIFITAITWSALGLFTQISC